VNTQRRTQRVKRFLFWFVAPFEEGLRGLSLTRLMAVTCFVYVGFAVANEHRLSWVDYNVLVLGIVAAFGKKMMYAWVTRQAQKHKDAPEEGP